MSYKVNISQRNKEIVNAEHRWELVLDRYLMTYSENGYEGFGIQQINYKKNQPVTIDIKLRLAMVK